MHCSVMLILICWLVLALMGCPQCTGGYVVINYSESEAGTSTFSCLVDATNETNFLITVTKNYTCDHGTMPYIDELNMHANTSRLEITFGKGAPPCEPNTDVSVKNRGKVEEGPKSYIHLMFAIYALSGDIKACDASIFFEATAFSTWLPTLELLNFTTSCNSSEHGISMTVKGQLPYLFYGLAAWTLVSTVLFVIVFIFCAKKNIRACKMRHVYATFNVALASERSSQVHEQRNFSRRPTRSLPPIPTPKPKSQEIHYANAHLRLSQNSMPARLRHSLHSATSGFTVSDMNYRNSLPLHASNVSAQNALYFFTRPGDLSPKDTPVEKTQGFTFPHNCTKPEGPKGLFKHHTMNHRSSTLFRKGRASDYQNWFQRFELSTSCPSIDAVEEGKEVTDKVKSMVPMRPKVEKRNRRSLIRNRLSSIYQSREQTLPRRKLPSLSRPLSEALLNPHNPYVESGTLPSPSSK